MIPVLYANTETEFISNGIGRLSDAISCAVTEERNGMFELQMTYPITGRFFKNLIPGAYVKAKNGSAINQQIFSIYKISKPLNGIVTINAEHISYQLNKIVTSPFTASSVAETLIGFESHASTKCPFLFWTDKSTLGDFSVKVPSSIRSKLGGSRGSVLDLYGGEFEFDNYNVKLWNNRGNDNGVVLRYGKNITDIKQEENIKNTITGAYPFWTNSEGAYYELPCKVITSSNAQNFSNPRIIPLDCSANFESQPTEEQLTEFATKYLKNNKAGIPEVSLTVSFVDLTQTEEYKDIAILEDVNMCDTVTVYFEMLGIQAKAKVVKTKYNVLKEQYDSIEIGDTKSNLSSSIVNQNNKIEEKPSKNYLEQAVQNATDLITGAKGGFVVLNKDANGKPYELLIMDTEDIATAKNIWRYNKNGWGHSKNGYNGPYALAATLDGGFSADFITAGTLNATIIKAGILTDSKNKSYWDLDKGILHINGYFEQETSEGMRSVDIANNKVNFYDWTKNGNRVGSVSATKKTNSDRVGLDISCTAGNYTSLGCEIEATEDSIQTAPVIQIDSTTYEESTPWIKNTVNGTLFPNNQNGGITVENGLIKNWNMYVLADGVLSPIIGLAWDSNNRITTVIRAQITIKDGLITGWKRVEETV